MTIEEAMKLEPGEVNRILAEFEGDDYISTKCDNCVQGVAGSEQDSYRCHNCDGNGNILPYYIGKPYISSLDACQTVKERLTPNQLTQFALHIGRICLHGGAFAELKATADQTARALAATVKGDL